MLDLKPTFDATVAIKLQAPSNELELSPIVRGPAGRPGPTDHLDLANIGTNTHDQIDNALARLAGTSGSNTGDETAASIATILHASASKAAPVDADELPIIDSAASNGLKKLTWANLKATLQAYFDALYQAVLVSGMNIKTINGTPLLGGGNIALVTNPAGAGTELQYRNGAAFGAMSGTAWDDVNRAETRTGATITASNPVQSFTQTWNNAGVVFTGRKVNITDTASAAGSLFEDWQIGGVSKASVRKDGSGIFGNLISTGSIKSSTVVDGDFALGNASIPYLSSYKNGSDGGIRFGRDGIGQSGWLWANNSSASLVSTSGSVLVYSQNSGGATVLGAGLQTGDESVIYGSANVSPLGATRFKADLNSVRNRDGTPLYISGGDGGATNRSGGSVYLDGGVATGTGTPGNVVVGAARGELRVQGAARFAALTYLAPYTTATEPSWVNGASFFNTDLDKLRIGGAAGWETVTSV